MDPFGDGSTYDFCDVDFAEEWNPLLDSGWTREPRSSSNVSRSIVPAGPLVVCEPPVILRPRFENGKCVGHEKIRIVLQKPSEADFAPIRKRYLDDYKAETVQLNREIYEESLTAKRRYRNDKRSIVSLKDAVASSLEAKVLAYNERRNEPVLNEIFEPDVSDVRFPSILMYEGLVSRAERQMLNRPILENPSNVNCIVMNTTTAYYSLMNSHIDGIIPFSSRDLHKVSKRRKEKSSSLTGDFKSVALPLIRLFSEFGSYRKRNRRSARPLTINGRSLFEEEDYFPRKRLQDIFPFCESDVISVDHSMASVSDDRSVRNLVRHYATISSVHRRMKVPLRRAVFQSGFFCNGFLTQLQKWVLHIPWILS